MPIKVLDSYIYQKYRHIAEDNIFDIKDKRRQFFKIDKDHYYRESPQEIYDSKTPEQRHDSSSYIGPHPFDDHQNVDSAQEINKKYLEGESIYDNQENESILGEKIDIKRIKRNLPTSDDFKELNRKF